MSVSASTPDSAALQPSAFLDRRTEDRLPVCVPIRVIYISGKRVSFDGTCTDVSTAGAAIEINGTMRVGDTIEFEFRNTNDIPAIHRARVLYRNGNHYGTYFLNAY